MSETLPKGPCAPKTKKCMVVSSEGKVCNEVLVKCTIYLYEDAVGGV
jgi:hypothetical protein